MGSWGSKTSGSALVRAARTEWMSPFGVREAARLRSCSIRKGHPGWVNVCVEICVSDDCLVAQADRRASFSVEYERKANDGWRKTTTKARCVMWVSRAVASRDKIFFTSQKAGLYINLLTE